MLQLNLRLVNAVYDYSFVYVYIDRFHIVDDYNKAIALEPHDVGVYNDLGITYLQSGEYDKAIVSFDKVLELNPRYIITYNNRGIAYSITGEYDKAIGDLTRAIELNPDYAFAYNNRGNAYDNTGEYDRAIKDYTKAIELEADYAEAYYNRGNAHDEKGERDKAIADYSQAIVLKPKVAEFYYTRGEAWLSIRKWEKAQRDLTAAILQGVDIAEVFHNTHDSIAAFEEEAGVKLPEGIVNLLTLRQEPLEIDKETRIALAMKYYENEELSSGLAARLAGVSREEFWYLMGDYGLSLFGTAEDLQEELENARKTSHQ